MQVLHIKAYPKLNISLKIFRKKKNGLHPLRSRFMLAISSLFDDMFFIPLDYDIESIMQNQIFNINEIAHKDGLYLMGNFNCDIESNLIFKAFKILNIKKKAFVIVRKHIPFGGGLGGGSVNAALSLLAFNEIFKLSLNLESLLINAQKLGSDVSFFVIIYTQCGDKLKLFRQDLESNNLDFLQNLDSTTSNFKVTNDAFYSANVMGFGEVIEPFFEDLINFNIYCNDVFCDTGAVYREFDNLQEQMQENSEYKKSYNTKIDLNLESRYILNNFSMCELNDLYMPAINLYPQLHDVARILNTQKEIYFSGSGSSFFSVNNF
ncbi:hypothetical protein DCO58_01625 [Helicobacter saguini]|uniref:GHMP kinase N-terminal domain-containing protein n=1 Tax=Helicobacter saguini TaxID=1548018 RepID=A0A099B6Q3_9HELI|nr:hypothetical protein [Helicobacter saguini]MWV62918.1 hypothetical protein [Helicobacter saguini]MWV66412.1 hypothetical protein [Helicobacter saguini]MWV68763.1 hypothetical protein [Helicobacter saguini]MWV71683.1 hypothetical protein [Helicobacter saguini]TLD91867.1 hypothetical protein LS64_011125 [Helicobacter saguini]